MTIERPPQPEPAVPKLADHAGRVERQAKIVATFGPASSSEEMIAELLESGVEVVRLNLSHGDHDSHHRMIATIRRIAERQGRFVPILFDLMGPRYRLGRLTASRDLEEGDRVILANAEDAHAEDAHAEDTNAEDALPVEDPSFFDHLRPGERILIDNGLVELEFLERRERQVHARVIHGGTVSARKGINLPDTDLPFTISAKDRDDIAFAVREGADFIAVSFVGGPEDLKAVRAVVKQNGGLLPLVAKLERATVTRRLRETIREADAVMVARGDLGVEVPLHEVSVWQKKIIQIGRRYGKPVIVATQMLESMMEHPRPTRAESSDVANAVFDGADALMLSGETAAGDYPGKAVRTMARIISEAEAYASSRPPTQRTLQEIFLTRHLDPGAPEQDALTDRDVYLEIPEVVCAAAVQAADRLKARRVVAFSQGGFTARMIARYRPQPPLTVFTPDARVARRLQLVWGARPLLIQNEVQHHDEVVRVVDHMLLAAGLAEPGDTIVILMGDPVQQKPLTNLMRVHRVRAHP